MLDPQGRVASWNEGARRLFGYAADEVMGTSYARFFPETETRDTETGQELAEAAARGWCESEGWRVRKDGTQFWASGTLTALHDAEGGLRGFSKVTRDITERKLLEEQLLRTADDLSQADQRKNQFLAVLAHELRTPLSAIANAAYLLENIQFDDRTLRQLGTISRQTRHLGRLVEDLMDISRISTGKIDLRQEPVEIVRVAGDAAQTVRSFIEARGQRLSCSFPKEPLRVIGDPTRLEQVLTNLLNNAAKYTEPGGQIWLTVERQGEQAVVRVRDSGIGIDPVTLPSIFDLFAQADPSEARSHGGLGIGLALVKRLVELHGGTVNAHSEGTGLGSEFMIRLPAAD